MAREPLFSTEERAEVEAISRLAYGNPFLGKRVELERQILGDRFEPFFPYWHPRSDVDDDNPNVLRIAERAAPLAERCRERLGAIDSLSDAERELYQGLCLYVLYYRCHAKLYDMVTRPDACDGGRRAAFYADYRKAFERLLGPTAVRLPPEQTPEHVFACFFQVRRAFHGTFRAIAGGSKAAASLRAAVWQSIFTHDLRRYQRSLYRRMGDVTTLITGPSGTGKELVARAIGFARYIPFDVRSKCFRESFEESFFPLNLSALSPTLIESELFGHRRGAFTGAVADRQGWLDVCPMLGTVFLDEIGEIDLGIQVKLLRVVETRVFQPLGSTDSRTFDGKVIAATNRDLGREMREGRFREDLYYRLCADTIVTPSLRERLDDAPEELGALALFLAQRLVGPDEAPPLAEETVAWIDANLGREYPWTGNVRELAQCVSNVLIHREYRPATRAVDAGWRDRLASRYLDGDLTADELLRSYCTLVYARTGSYVGAAEKLGLDRRTVKSRVDPALLAEVTGEAPR